MFKSQQRWWILLVVIPILNLSAWPTDANADPPIALHLGEPIALAPTAYTFNTNLLTATAFQNRSYGGLEFQRVIADLQPHGLRFPGGTIANNYLWKDDSFSEPTNDKTKWAAEQLKLFRKIGRPYDVKGFAATCAPIRLRADLGFERL